MTDASMNVATIESRPPPLAPEATGRNRSALDKANEASKTEGKTFAETLKAAEGGQAEKSEKAGKSDRTEKANRSKTQAAGKKTLKEPRTGISAFRVKTAKAGEDQKAVAGEKSADAVKNRNELLLGENAESAAGENHGLQTAAAESVLQSGAATPAAGKVKAVRSGDSGAKIKPASTARTGNESTGNKASGEASSIESSKTDLSSVSGKVEIVDKREFSELADSGTAARASSAIGKDTRRSAAKVRSDAAPRTESANFRQDNTAIAETEIDLSPASGKSFNSRTAAAELSKKLDTQAGNEIVRQVKVVLNRSDAGEVRINLRPDNLGRVRVRIQMEDNRLTGRIFVESAAAREAFRDALDGLQAKLVEAGFGSADLELTWDDSPGGFAEGQQQGKGKSANSGQAAREFENMVPTTVVDETADGRVNLVV